MIGTQNGMQIRSFKCACTKPSCQRDLKTSRLTKYVATHKRNKGSRR